MEKSCFTEDEKSRYSDLNQIGVASKERKFFELLFSANCFVIILISSLALSNEPFQP